MNHHILQVIALALLPAFGNFAGGLIAEWLEPSKRLLNRALHAAAGIILAVIAVEVMPEALEVAPAWLLAIAFVAGGMAYLGLEGLVDRWLARRDDSAGKGAWMVYLAVATDLLGDGLLIGAGSAVSMKLALVLAVGQVMADVPEGFAVIANFRAKGVGRAKRLWLAASFAAPVVGAAVLSYFLLREQSHVVKMAAVVFVAGLFILGAMEDMLREAHEADDDSRWSAMSLLLGFALFVLVTGGVE
jgi:ZIP family zinc transporter